MTAGRRTRLATYRVQLRAEFGFAEAAAIAPYLAALGVSHLYTSPYLQAAPGSTHGYDVVDHGRVNDELGGPSAHDALCAALADAGLGHVVDVVPNHMAIGSLGNRWWWDVLEDGPASRYAAFFDVDWEAQAAPRNRLLLPVLGDHYGRVLEAGDVRVVREADAFRVAYFDHRFPMAPRSLAPLLQRAAERCGDARLSFLADALAALPRTVDDRGSADRRHRDKQVLLELLRDVTSGGGACLDAVDDAVDAVNGDFARLHDVLEAQHYRLAYWRLAAHELDYRRFFDVASLVGLRVELPQVFAEVHDRVLDWHRRGLVDGIRVDHVDGLVDPAGYLGRLRATAPEAWLLVEKILEPGEALREWPIEGTTGYEFARVADGLFVDPDGEAPLTELWHELSGDSRSYDEVVATCKRQVLRAVLAADVARLTELFRAVCEDNLHYRDFSRDELRAALEALLEAFPVYRTYVRPGPPGEEEVSERDVDVVAEAVATARGRRPEIDPELLDFLADALLLRVPGAAAVALATRFQQVSGPVMAKGVEDTAFYRYVRLVSRNEVGGDPGRFACDPEEIHAHNSATATDRPSTLLALSTHDTKRSEDVRARIHLLSEIPQQWADAVRRWRSLNERHRRGGVPDAASEYLLYQTLVGAHPLPVERAVAYMEKAVREAKDQTSWMAPDAAFESGVRAFVEAVLHDDVFLDDLATFVEPLVEPGRVNALAAKLVQLTSPGVPDLYQGSELWTDSLVDPDNRRPVDFAGRAALLAELGTLDVGAVRKRADEGLPKLLVVQRALDVRRRFPACFGPVPGGAYTPLAAAGRRARHLVAFGRGSDVVVLVPRLVLGLGGDWGDTVVTLAPGRWRDAFTGDTHEGGARPVASLLDRFPVGLLTSE